MSLEDELRRLIGEGKVSTSLQERVVYGADAFTFSKIPAVVVQPESHEEVLAVLKVASQHERPVIPRGGGSGLAGAAVPTDEEAIIISTTRLNKILELDLDNLCARAEAGVMVNDLAKEIEQEGFWFPPLPSSAKVATVGGVISTNASGKYSMKYGVTGNYVRGLKIALPTGETLELGSKVVNSVSGYDLKSLYVGSEGTLGVVTEAIVGFIPKPREVATVLIGFEQLEDAAQAISRIIREGLYPAVLELMDSYTITSVKRYTGIDLPEGAIVLAEADGMTEEEVQRGIEAIVKIGEEEGSSLIRYASTSAERTQIMEARDAAFPALASIKPIPILEDIAVPIKHLPQMIREIQRISKDYDVIIGTYGHAGRGLLHPQILIDDRDGAEVRAANQAIAEMFKTAIKLGGTLSGEHGIGMAKKDYMPLEHSKLALEQMKSIKQLVDPQGIMNPCKILSC